MNVNTKGQFIKGGTPWNKGLKTGLVPKSAFKKGVHSSPMTEFKKGENKGEYNYQWRGDNVSYRALHAWVERCLGKAASCSNNKTHKSKRYHWANISHEYKRDLSDYKSLCVSCHKKYDLYFIGRANYV